MQPHLGIPTREGVSLHCLTQCYLSFTGRVPSLAPGMESKLRRLSWFKIGPEGFAGCSVVGTTCSMKGHTPVNVHTVSPESDPCSDISVTSASCSTAIADAL
jgi:hypothetical protein